MKSLAKVAAGIILLAGGFLALVLGVVATLLTGGKSWYVIAVGGILLLLGVGFLASALFSAVRGIKNSMESVVEAREVAGVATASRACPECGGSQGTPDRFGITTCDKCGARFVRA